MQVLVELGGLLGHFEWGSPALVSGISICVRSGLLGIEGFALKPLGFIALVPGLVSDGENAEYLVFPRAANHLFGQKLGIFESPERRML
jgi:hypothetical protein